MWIGYGGLLDTVFLIVTTTSTRWARNDGFIVER